MARFVTVSPSSPGYRRVRAGAGFRYLTANGRRVSPRARARIDHLAIPPAWRDVWISAHPRGHIQAIGTDGDGRRQYLYHESWIEDRDAQKFDRALALAQALPRARAHVTTALRRSAIDRERVLAAAFRLLDVAAPRVGSPRYLRRYGSRGLTTLQRKHAMVEGERIVLSFRGKSGKHATLTVVDADLAALMSELAAGNPRATLMSYAVGRRLVALTETDVNDYIKTCTGGAFSAKDFRTLRATIVAAQCLACAPPETDAHTAQQDAVRAAAALLGNTPAVARASYIDPRVFDAHARRQTLDTTITPESAIQQLLQKEKRSS